MTAAMTASTFFGTGIPVQAADGWIGDGELAENNTEAPSPDEVLPTKNQYRYQKDELAAFCHFGPNTFNEIEWGENYGNKTPDEIFKLENDFDADNYVKALKDAGFKKLIVTAKHHDGFCIWASDYTDYDVAETSYKDGQGDILAEISAACTKYDMDMGLYLSPWDIHDESYGYYDQNGNPTTADNDYLDYNEYYNNQLIEILGGEEYGNDGHFVEVWMDGAKGSGQDAQEYDFVKWFDTIQKYEGEEAGYDSDCMLFGAEAYTTVRWIGNENGYAAKNTWAKSKVNYENNTINSNSSGGYTIGFEDGNQWTVPEADARITSGWFWGTTKNTPKSIKDLASMYFGSIGNNATLLLNIPPNNEGTVDQAILDRVDEFGDNIRETFSNNLAAAEGASVYADNVRGNDTAFRPGSTVDGDDSTYWTTDDGTNTGTLLIDLGGVKTFDVVSVEEAIQNGQRINEYSIEYRNSNGQWNTLDSGETIGAKRLSRSSAVRGDQVRITVSVPEGKVPMISEVGVYKASDGFELAGAAPEGMDVLDISTNSFSFSNGWTNETGPNFIGGTNKWANPGASFTLEFEGSKVYLLGTKDPNHGTADIYIDDTFVETIDTNASARALGQMIFESDDLEDGSHTLRLEVKNKAIGIESAYVINNGGKGMVGLEYDSYTMNEDTRMDVKLFRVGGSDGEVTVRVSPNPGSAIQDDFDTELITEVTFADGQTEATAPVQTRRNTNQTGDREFSIELTALTDGLILGFNDKADITILDTESSSIEGLQDLVDEGQTALSDWYISGWDEYAAAVADGAALLEKPDSTAEKIASAIEAINRAKENLVAREKYTEDDPFVFPWRTGSTATLEGEFASVLINDESNDGAGPWPLQVAEGTWASNGKFLNSLNNGDIAKYYFTAEKAGTYNVTAVYRSGSNTNALAWTSEPADIVEAGSVSAGAGAATVTHEVEFTITVNTPGTGMLVFTGPAGNSPQLDKLVITPGEIELGSYTITASAGEGGSISDAGETAVTEGESKTYTITPDDGYKIADVKINGESVGAADTYTFENVTADATIEAVFAFANYTEANPFVFPSAVGGTPVVLEAEYSILHNVELASDGQWALCVSDGDWASNGQFINCLNQQDTISIPYYAEKAGTYSLTAYYRSGDPQNALQWSEENGKITEGSVIAGANDGAGATHQVTFEMEITEPGAGMLVFTGPDRKSPQLDKFDIVLTEDKTEVPEVNKDALAEAISAAEAEAAKTDVYTAESIEALMAAIEAAQAVYDNAEAQQEDVDAQVAALEDAVAALEEIETPEPEPGKEISTAVLEYAVELAADVNTDGVMDVVKENFETALQNAKDILAKVQSGDASVTQNDVDSAWQNLIKAMQYMEFKSADKEDLAKVIALAEEMNNELDKYLEAGKDAFTAALAAAQEVYADDFASQEEVNDAWMNLLNAMADLRLIPDKSLLEDLIAEAESLNADDYDAESYSVVTAALASAKAVFADENAAQEEIDESAEALRSALAQLTASAGNDGQAQGTAGEADKNSSASSENSGAKAVKTGDTANVLPFAAAAVLAAAAAAAVLKKKEEK